MTEGGLDFGKTGFDKREVYRYMGIPAGDAPYEIRAEVDRLAREAASVCRPRFCHTLLPLEKCAPDFLIVGGKKFLTGKIISLFFAEADSCLICVSTSGREFEKWAGAFSASGDILRTFIADSIGSGIAEAVSRTTIRIVSENLARKGVHTGNSYSPGYCGWDVAEQQKLFSLLPAFPAGITLTASSLMSPIKSVSAIVPAGAKVRRMPYGCSICERKNCYKRKEVKIMREARN